MIILKISVNSPCPCGSRKKYKKCCKIYHNGVNPKHALELMKSRYSAFVLEDAKYIMKTTHKDNPDFTSNLQSWNNSILQFSKNSDFLGLEIIDFIDDENISFVTFKALISQDNKDISFVEKSKFLKEDNMWKYHSGEFLDG